MRLRTVPSGVLEHVLHMSNRLPVPIAETFGAMMLARSVEAATNLGIFTYLGRSGQASLERLCTDLELNQTIVGALLHALEGTGYVSLKQGLYRNTPLSQRFLVEESEQYVGNFIRYNGEQRVIWLALEKLAKARDGDLGLNRALRAMAGEMMARMPAEDDADLNFHHVLRDDEVWRRYMYGLRDLARLSIPELQLYLRFPRGIRRLLDLGGGHGAYSSWMCQRHPDLTSTIYDLEGASRIGRELIRDAGLADRVHYVDADLSRMASFGDAGYDVVFCFNIIHHLKPEENLALIRKAVSALKPGGSLVIWDEFRDEELKRSEIARFVGLMFLLASGGDTYTFSQVREWMERQGLRGIRQRHMHSAPGTGLLIGRSHA